MKKIKLYLMNKKGYNVLNFIINSNQKILIDKVISSRDLAVENDYFEEIKKLCLENYIIFMERKENIIEDKKLSIAIGWRWIVSGEKLIVLHDSLLPRYRGFTPLVNCLINGETEIGVTALYATNEYDKGDVIIQEKIKNNYPKKIKDAIEEITESYIKCIEYIFNKIEKNEEIESFPQEEIKATYSIWRDNEDYFINWKDESEKIRNTIDAIGYPYSGAHTFLNSEIIVIENSELEIDVHIENRNDHIGKVIFLKENKPVVICGKGLLKIENAYYKNNGKNIIPLKKFRSRFGGKQI